MMTVEELQRWAMTLEKANCVAIDDGGLTLVELNDKGERTGAYYEVGGIPLPDGANAPGLLPALVTRQLPLDGGAK